MSEREPNTTPARPAEATDEEYLIRLARRHAEALQAGEKARTSPQAAFSDPTGQADQDPTQTEKPSPSAQPAAEPKPGQVPPARPVRPERAEVPPLVRRARRAPPEKLSPAWRLSLQIALLAALTALALLAHWLARA